MSNFRWEGTEISPSLFFIFGRQTVPAKMHGGCHCCHSETVSFVVSLLSRDVPCECSISECLAIVPLTRHQFRTKSGQFNGCLHACLHENILASENPEKRRAYSSAFTSKMWYCIRYIFRESNFSRIGTSRHFREWLNSRSRRSTQVAFMRPDRR